ncbi:hypothetical protein F5Y16DRAFT_232594 [Xylariaceae sp. FL0255]|nr:hypothetical protein F5Y16DRAFT_232594 [Xylariaceae sp. FL0255]
MPSDLGKAVIGRALIGGALLDVLTLRPARRKSESQVYGSSSTTRGHRSRSRPSRYSEVYPPRYHEFQHHPLPNPAQQIRLVRIDGTLAPGDLIQCELRVINIADNSFHYYALSYTWGNPNRKRNILLNGGIFQVSENLHEFLEHAVERINATAASRGQRKWSGWWWIDALCINQRDIYGEKSVQLALMGNIFTSAWEVIAWIGEAGDHTKMTFRRLRALCPPNEELRGRRPSPAERRLLKELRQEPGLASGINHMFKKPYWERMWILQELALSQHTILVCGTYELKWTVMVDFAMKMQLSMKGNPAKSNAITILGNAQRAVENTRNVWLISQIHRHSPEYLDFSLILYLSRHQQTRETKDRIYALLSLVSKRYKDIIGPPRQDQSPCQLFGLVSQIVYHDMQTFRFVKILEQAPDDYPHIGALCYDPRARADWLRRLRLIMEYNTCHNPFALPTHHCSVVNCQVFRCMMYRCPGNACLNGLYRFLESIYDIATVYTLCSGDQQIELGGHEASISRSRSRSRGSLGASSKSRRRSKSRLSVLPKVISSFIGGHQHSRGDGSPDRDMRAYTRGRSLERRYSVGPVAGVQRVGSKLWARP